ncbi:STAS domain-containing protein [Nocardioides sp.]|uniref:STAS domain-containing protein n=1 Tax=Nocardioides sp. TaxID=35761 RepID=UPI00378445A3
MEFTSLLTQHDDHADLAVSGELDAFTAGQVRRQVDDAVFDGFEDFVVDVSDVTFVDAGGLSVFVRLRNAMAVRGGAMTITVASPRFRQVTGVAGLAAAFGLDVTAVDDGHLVKGCAVRR